MAARILQLRNDLPYFSLQSELDGVTYQLEFWWNWRTEQWLMSIKTAEGESILTGLALVVDFPLGRRFKDARLPPGVLSVIDTTGKDRDPGLTDLGSRVLLMYLPAADLESL